MCSSVGRRASVISSDIKHCLCSAPIDNNPCGLQTYGNAAQWNYGNWVRDTEPPGYGYVSHESTSYLRTTGRRTSHQTKMSRSTSELLQLPGRQAAGTKILPPSRRLLLKLAPISRGKSFSAIISGIFRLVSTQLWRCHVLGYFAGLQQQPLRPGNKVVPRLVWDYVHLPCLLGTCLERKRQLSRRFAGELLYTHKSYVDNSIDNHTKVTYNGYIWQAKYYASGTPANDASGSWVPGAYTIVSALFTTNPGTVKACGGSSPPPSTTTTTTKPTTTVPTTTKRKRRGLV